MVANTNEMDHSLVLYQRKIREAELNRVVRNSAAGASDGLYMFIARLLRFKGKRSIRRAVIEERD